MEARKNLEDEISEFQRLESLTNHPRIKEFLSEHWHKLEADLIVLEDEELIASNTECILHKDEPKPADASLHDHRLNECDNNEDNPPSLDVYLSSYAWDQSDSHVTLYVSEDLSDIELLDPQFITTSFTSISVRLAIHQFKGRNFHFIVETLWGNIVPHESHLKIRKDHLVLILKKTIENKHWPSITAVELRKDHGDIDRDTKQAIVSAAAANDASLKMVCGSNGDEHLKSL